MTLGSKRTLKAILFADIEGYTSLMQENESQAADILDHFRTNVQTKTAGYNGQIVNFYGDGVLCLFDSPLDALRCSIALQTIFSNDSQVPVRIGVHMGTVVEDGGNVFGDNVNIASRIESLGIPGAVLISNRVKQEIANQPEFIIHSLGKFSFKNVKEKTEVFALGNEGCTIPQKKQVKGKVNKTSKKPIYLFVGLIVISMLLFVLVPGLKKSAVQSEVSMHPKSIAVMPFQNLSPDNNDLFYCNGIMQNVIDALSKVPEFIVLPSRTTNLYADTKLATTELGDELGVQYIIDGTFQKIGSEIQVTVALTSTDEGRQIWTNEKNTFSLPELFYMQAQIANQVAGQLKTTLSTELNKTIETIPTRDELAYEYYLRGKEKLRNVNYHTNTNSDNVISLNEAKQFFNLAIERDTNFANAYLGLARAEYTDFENYHQKYNKDSTQFLQFEKLVNKALQLDPELSEAFSMKGIYYLQALKAPHKAEKNLIKALEVNPNNIEALYAMADLYLWGKLDIVEAVRLLKEIEYRTVDEQELYEIYLKLSQAYSKLMDPKMEWYYLEKCNRINNNAADLAVPWFYLRTGQFEKALAELSRRFPNKENQFQFVLYGLYHSVNGQFQEAVKYYEQWAKIEEVQSADNWFSTNDWHRYGQALVKVGEDSLGIALIGRQIAIYKQGIEQGGANYYDLAGSYAFLNKKDSAYYYLDQMFEANGLLGGWGGGGHLLVDYQFDNIRSDQKFNEKLEVQKARLRKIRKQVYSIDPSAPKIE